MNYASDDLKHEHDAILFALKVLEEFCVRIEKGADIPAGDISSMTGFLKLFADRCHHGKEELFYFPAMEEAGVQKQNGPIGMLLEEHEKGRLFLKSMDSSVSGRSVNNEIFVKSAKGYIELMRSHIEKENNVVFAVGDEKISPAKHSKLLEEFERFEEEVIGAGKHEELHAMLDDFKKRYMK